MVSAFSGNFVESAPSLCDDFARVLFYVQGAEMACAAWVHQENAEDIAGRFSRGDKTDEGDRRLMSKKRNPHIGGTLDEFLKDEGILEELQTQAITEVVAWQLAEAMKARGVSKADMAKLLHTSCTQVDRLLDPESYETLSSLQRAAALVGRQVRLELV